MSFIIDAATDSITENFSEDTGLSIQPENSEEPIEVTITGDAPVEVTSGGLADFISTGAGDALVFTGDGDDTILGGTGNDILRGGKGNDFMRGGLGSDYLFGGEGDDTINGGLGAKEDGELLPIGDTLKGGIGNDVFQFSVGPEGEFKGGETDVITDFKADGFADKIQLFGLGSTDAEAVTYNAEDGFIYINGEKAIDIGTGQDVQFKVSEDGNNWELF